MIRLLRVSYLDSMKQIFHLLLTTVPHRWFSTFRYLIAATVACAFLEVFSLSLIIPFVNAMIKAEGRINASLINPFLIGIGVQATPLVFGAVILMVLLTSGAARLVLLFVCTRFCFGVGRDLSNHIYSTVIQQPYSIHTGRNSAEVITNVNVHVNEVIFYGLMPAVNFLSNSIFMIILLCGVLYFVPGLSLIVITGFGLAYIGYAIRVKKKINQRAERISTLQVSLTQHIQESLQGIREILLDQSQNQMRSIFNQKNRQLRRDQSVVQYLAQSPRFILETLGMIVLISLCMLMLGAGQSFNALAGSLALLALGLQRILPSAQQAFQSWVLIQSSQQAVKGCFSLLQFPIEHVGVSSALELNQRVAFEDVSFRYPNRDKDVLKNLSLCITKGERIGILGKSGQGKSTFLDLLLGLQQPTSGKIFVDESEILNDVALNWRRSVAHVPQHFLIVDGTLSDNIAWGVEGQKVDHALVEQCARIAGLDELINGFPYKYSTAVGERGVLFSGGQRQRLAIARAFYKRSTLIVLDEATSALDSITESEILDTIFSHNRDLTIVMVSHQMNALLRCDRIFEMKDGALILSDRG